MVEAATAPLSLVAVKDFFNCNGCTTCPLVRWLPQSALAN